MWFSETVQDNIKIHHVILNFMPSWWHTNYGIEFGEKMVFSPEYRCDMHREMRRLYYERFGRKTGIGEPNPGLWGVPPDWQNAITAAFLGGEVNYPVNGYPESHIQMSDGEIAAYALPDDLWAVFPYSELKKQTAWMNRKFNTDNLPFLSFRSIVNDAESIRGMSVLADFVDEEADYAQTVLDFAFKINRRQFETNDATSGHNRYITANCMAGLISPATYEDRILPYDRKMAEMVRSAGGEYGLHHCGNFDGYIPYYQQLNPLFMLDIGHTSDLKTALDAFPDILVSYIIDNNLINHGTAAEIKAFVGDLLDKTQGDWHRIVFNVADMDIPIPDENLLALLEAVSL